MHAEPTGTGAPFGSCRLLPEPHVELPMQTAVAALEQNARVTAGVDEAVLFTGDDGPDPLQRVLVGLWQHQTFGLLPLAGRIVGDPQLRSVKGIGGRGEVPARPGV